MFRYIVSAAFAWTLLTAAVFHLRSLSSFWGPSHLLASVPDLSTRCDPQFPSSGDTAQSHAGPQQFGFGECSIAVGAGLPLPSRNHADRDAHPDGMRRLAVHTSNNVRRRNPESTLLNEITRPVAAPFSWRGPWPVWMTFEMMYSTLTICYTRTEYVYLLGRKPGVRVGVELSPVGAKDTAQSLSPLPGLGVPRQAYPGLTPGATFLSRSA